jgi:hypothetical protein
VNVVLLFVMPYAGAQRFDLVGDGHERTRDAGTTGGRTLPLAVATDDVVGEGDEAVALG